MKLFCLEFEAKKMAELTKLNRVTINRFYTKFWERIAEFCESESPFENGVIELDESYFFFFRVSCVVFAVVKPKEPVFGMLKRGDKVYTQIVKSIQSES